MGACSAAVIVGAGTQDVRLFSSYNEQTRGHAEALMPMIEKVMEEAGTGFEAIDRIAVTRGPGTFTGVRVGVAAARGIALGANIPVVGETSLIVLARTFLQKTSQIEIEAGPFDRLVVAVDARRGELYAQQFTADGAPLSDAEAITADTAAKTLPLCGVVLAIGSGAPFLAAAAEGAGVAVQIAGVDLQPDASALATLAKDLPLVDGPVSPLYLRAPDARPQVGKSIERAL